MATAMYYTGLDPFTKRPVHIAKNLSDRKLQGALMQFFKPENYFEVRRALEQAGRQDLIGNGCDALVPAHPPNEAIERRRKDANARFRGEYVHTVPGGKKRKESKKQSRNPAVAGYRPDRKAANRPARPRERARDARRQHRRPAGVRPAGRGSTTSRASGISTCRHGCDYLSRRRARS